MPHHGIIFGGKSVSELFLMIRVLKASGRPLSTVETFAKEFIPTFDEGVSSNDDGKVTVEKADSIDAMPSEISSVSVHALDIVAEINAKENPELAKKCLRVLADQYDTMRKGYWEFRIERLG
jgi:hypothetical protein